MRAKLLPSYWLLLSVFVCFAGFVSVRRPKSLSLRPLPLCPCDIPVALPDGMIRCLSTQEALDWNVQAGDVPPLSASGTRLFGPPNRMSGERQLALGLPIDPNEASQADMEALPDVGPALAQAIVTARRQRRFQTEADLLSVRGLGPKRLAKLRPYLQLRKTR